MAAANGYAKKLCTIAGKRMECITIHMGTKIMRAKPIDCIIDASAPPKGIVLGLQAMTIIGYNLLIDEVATSHHETQRLQVTRPLSNVEEEIPEEPFQEEEFVLALTEAEKREIENIG